MKFKKESEDSGGRWCPHCGCSSPLNNIFNDNIHRCISCDRYWKEVVIACDVHGNPMEENDHGTPPTAR